MERWVKEWLEEQRGERGFEVKIKKRRKSSEYIGILRPNGLKEKEGDEITVQEYGSIKKSEKCLGETLCGMVASTFFYCNRLIKAGKLKGGYKNRYNLYLYFDPHLSADEENTLYRIYDEGKLNKEKLEKMLRKTGKNLIISNLDHKPEKIFHFYKERGHVEEAFDIFTSFLSLYVYCRIQNLLKKAGLLNKLPPYDLLIEYSKVYMIKIDGKKILSEVTTRVKDIDSKLGLNIFPK